MQIISSYGVELRKQNIPIRQTLEIYRSAVSYLIGIYVQVWKELAEIPDAKRRFNAAEHLVAVQVALKNQMTLSLEIALGSSLQIALFVAPVLVIVAAFMGRELGFRFNVFELVALASAGIVAVFVFKDGRSNWLEGAQLLALYLILGVAFFFI